MTRVAIVVGSTRQGRKSEAVARWVQRGAARRADAQYELVDLASHGLPHLGEPEVGSADDPGERQRRWAERVASFDGFVFVTPEYNHSMPGVLKNAIDHVRNEWYDKAAGFVGYGTHGGTRAVEQLRLVMGELQVADVRAQVALSLFTDFDGTGEVAPDPRHEQVLDTMLGQVVRWSDALAPLRSSRAA